MKTLHPKVQSALVAGSVTTILVWVAMSFGLVVPPEVASAFTTLVALVVGYLTPDA